MTDTIVTVTVHFENRPDRDIELLNPTQMNPKNLQRAAKRLAEYQSYDYKTARDKPAPTWAEVKDTREVEITEVEE